MIKILHSGDIHLDSPFSQLPPDKAEVRKNELRGTFTSLMTFARTENIDLMLIAGDFFDNDFVTRETLALIISEIGKLKCPVVISPGNHDFAREGSVWKKDIFPKNTFIFTSDKLSSFEFPEIGVRVYGWAFTDPAMRQNPLAGHRAERDGLINVLCAHCDLIAPVGPSCPVSVRELEEFGADYNALGHIHNPDEEGVFPKNVMYCGCLESRSYDETGPKGAVLCTIERDGGGAVRVSPQRIRFSKRRYENMTLAVDGASTNYELKEKIAGLISERKLGADTLLRVTLTGNVDESLVVNVGELERSTDRLFSLTVRDETVPLLNASSLASDPTVRGEVYRLLLPLITSDDPEERARGSAALRYSLAALAGESVTTGENRQNSD